MANKQPSLGDLVESADLPPERIGSLWKGPTEDGITYSMLTRFLTCRERFRVAYVEGLQPTPVFNHRIEYGQMWHICEEALAKGPSLINGWCPAIEGALKEYVVGLAGEYPFQKDQVYHWYNVCRVQFPLYVSYWARQNKAATLSPYVQEQTFDVKYDLPSGREVRLRGKWDAVHEREKGKYLVLQENKTKSEIDVTALNRQLGFDLQTMLYLTALEEDRVGENKYVSTKQQIGGVLYNVVRRPLSGGKGTIVRHKATKSKPEETWESFYGRLAEYIREDPASYFQRWEVTVTEADVNRFRRRCLDPILEQLCDWWDWIKVCGDNPFSPDDGCENSLDQSVRSSIHWQHPYGSINWIDEAGWSDLDSYLESGSEVGLRRREKLFEELDV